MSINQQRYVIVNADDFGLSAGINRGIIEAHCYGIVTSASLMVRWPAAVEAVAMASECPALSLGLHFDFGEWAFRGGKWQPLYFVVNTEDSRAVEQEIRQQLERFCGLTGNYPTHLDSHQHVHRQDPARSLLMNLAAELAIPLRHFSPHIRYCGEYYGQTATGEPVPQALRETSLIELLRQSRPGVTELGCHPGYGDDLDTMYRSERSVEVVTLCSQSVRKAIAAADIALVNFGEARLLAPAASDEELIGKEVCR